MSPSSSSRRRFLGTATLAAGSLALARPALFGIPAAKKTFRVGLIGCGGRGRGALSQHLKAAEILNDALDLGLDMKVAATADWFESKAVQAGQPYEVPRERCFSGPKAYQELVQSGVDIVLMATPPAFRPLHVEAAVRAGKHVFMEKPVAVDPPGCRRVIAAGEEAKRKGLMVIAGTQRRHQKNYLETHAAVMEGAIGEIVGGRVAWNAGHFFAKRPIEPKTHHDVVRTWKDWVHLSGDHICEQHVHNLDVMNWFVGSHPTSAGAFGGRARRTAGTQFDFFSIDYEFPNDVNVHSMCRQINGCWRWVGEKMRGQTGATRCAGDLVPKRSPVDPAIPQVRRGHQQEHINLLYWLARGKIVNEAENVAVATATAILGRESAYTGRRLSWDAMMENPAKEPELFGLTLRPTAEDYEKGDVPIPEEGKVAVPGKSV